MDDEHLLRAHKLGDAKVYVLARVGRKKDFFEEMVEDPRRRAATAMCVKSLRAIMDNGMQYAVFAGLAKRISDEIFLIECKGRATTYRVMAYIHELGAKGIVPILLGIYNGHQGKTGIIPSKTKKSFERRARIAQEIAREEFGNGD